MSTLSDVMHLVPKREFKDTFSAETVVMKEYFPTEGTKFDTGKVRYDLIPPEALEEWAAVMTFGAQKYADRNWEKGMKWGRVFGALMRHSWAWWRGEDNDPETGLSHMGHVICCASFLLTYSKRKVGEDDRV